MFWNATSVWTRDRPIYRFTNIFYHNRISVKKKKTINDIFFIYFFLVIHNYTEYNQQWNVFSVFDPFKCARTHARTCVTVNKYRFCISVIRYINVQIIGIGNKKNQYRSITILNSQIWIHASFMSLVIDIKSQCCTDRVTAKTLLSGSSLVSQLIWTTSMKAVSEGTGRWKYYVIALYKQNFR